MNYIYELNSFWKFTETNPIDGYTILLYLALLQFHNTSGWKKTIRIENKRLEVALGVSEKTLIKHRKILIDLGLLRYSSRQRVKKSGEYSLLSFQSEEIGQAKTTEQTAVISTAESKAEDDLAGKITADSSAELSADRSDLYKQDETKSIITIEKKDNEELDFLLTICQQNNFDIDDKTEKWLLELMKTYKIIWIQKAICEASKKNNCSKEYIKGILKNWKVAGKVTTFSSNITKCEVNSSYKNTRFHNFKQRSDNYTADELEEIAKRKRSEFSERLKSQNKGDNFLNS